jgi:conjugative transfer signal peptidase TraF
MTIRNRNSRLTNFLTPRGFGIVAAAFALCGYAASAPGSPRTAAFVWNATASAPIGLYRVRGDRALARGDLVLALPAPSLAAFAARQGYLPSGVPLVKRIAAVAGDAVCTRGDAIFINGRVAAARRAADGKGRPLPAWAGCARLRRSEVFLLMETVADSFDGRYFGPTPASQIVGRLVPLWTR